MIVVSVCDRRRLGKEWESSAQGMSVVDVDLWRGHVDAANGPCLLTASTPHTRSAREDEPPSSSPSFAPFLFFLFYFPQLHSQPRHRRPTLLLDSVSV
jgi:hypothetical protein